MHYSHCKDGIYCRACVVFSTYQAGGQGIGRFVLEPFRYWTKASSKAVEHAKHSYHLNAVAAMSEFLTCYEKPSQAIDVVMSRQVSQIMERNEKVLESLLKITIFCGKQGLALRGHRDDKID